MISIREERAGEDSGVRDLNTAAFGRSVEGEIVDRLREACPDLVSLVAVDGERIVGHILFSPVTVERGPAGMVLAPLAVLPEYQRRGIGSALVEHGLAALRERGCPFVILYGHPGYYPRFGFEPASARGLASHLGEVPDDVFMVLVLDADAMEGVGGRDPAAGRVRRSDEVGTAHPGDRSAGAGPAIGGGAPSVAGASTAGGDNGAVPAAADSGDVTGRNSANGPGRYRLPPYRPPVRVRPALRHGLATKDSGIFIGS